MRKPLSLFAAAALSAGVFAYLGYDSAVFAKDDQQKSTDVSGSSRDSSSSSASGQSSSSTSGLRSSSSAYSSSGSLPQGVTKSAQADEAGIRSTISQVTITVVKEDGLKQLPSYLARSDQQRLTNLSGDQINDKIKQIQQAFKQKYNKDFQPDQTTLADQFKDLTIVQGEVSNPALLSNWPVNSSGSSSSTTGGTGSSRLRSDTSGTSSGGLSGSSSSTSGGIGSSSSSTDRNSSSSTSGIGASSSADRSSSSSSSGTGLSGSSSSSGLSGSSTSGVQKGFGVAIVTFPASHGAPEVTVSLVRESSATGAAGASGASTGTGSPDRFGTSSAGSSTADRSSTAGTAANTAGSSSSTADRSSTAGTSSSSTGIGASATAGTSTWKIDLPDTMTADKVQTNLAKHLDEVIQMKEQWPTDANDCQKMLSHHIFMALYDVD
ncbi:MAG TPA: hypothetical protein VGP94_09280, partial [Tepidisphaeraceae bacterium]|nr:hypothetical protein [Tepidisphaeraceae bacterium]